MIQIMLETIMMMMNRCKMMMIKDGEVTLNKMMMSKMMMILLGKSERAVSKL
jgi:hypothetical protein